MRPRAILVTGATGLVGHELMDHLRRRGDARVVGVSRRGSTVDPDIVAWDMASAPPPDLLSHPWDAIVNAAADTRWTMSPAEAVSANVDTVRALAQLASEDTHMIHLSTTCALGLRNGVDSADLSDYRNTYEWSKAYAERVARAAFPRLTVVRPPLLIGRRSDGRAARFSGVYTMVRGLVLGTVPAIVAEPGAFFDTIPVDELCQLLTDLAAGSTTGAGSVLTIAGGSAAPTVVEAVGAITDSLNDWRRRHGLPPLPRLPLITPESWNRFFRPFAQIHLSPRQLLILDLLRNFEPYLALSDPFRPDHMVKDVLPALAVSVDYWAETNPRIAARSPRPWRTATSSATRRRSVHA